MILVLRNPCTTEQSETVLQSLGQMGLTGHVFRNAQSVLVSIFEDVSKLPSHVFTKLPGVEKVLRTGQQVSIVTDARQEAVVLPNGLMLGAGRAVIMAGPCSVEGRSSFLAAARKIKLSGADVLRGGAFKPRTSPYDFQGLGEEGLKILDEARRETALPVVSEVITPEHVETAVRYIDILQVGARNMYNYELLKEVGRSNHPVLLKRAFSATIHEWLCAAEYILMQGNSKVILCERGIRTFETYTRNTLDLAAVAAIRGMTKLPIVVDPSHATGRPELVRPLSRAAISCGANGLIIEVHDSPSQALSDGDQAISTDELRRVVYEVKHLEGALNELSRQVPHPLNSAEISRLTRAEHGDSCLESRTFSIP